MQLGELLLLKNTQTTALPPLQETVESVSDHHLDVERLVLLQKGSLKTQLPLQLTHLPQKLLGQFCVLLPVAHPRPQVLHLALQQGTLLSYL